MKAISLWEPWASLVRAEAKKFETRSWETDYRGDLLICAAQRKVIYEVSHYLSFWTFQGGLAPLVGKPLDLSFKSWPGVKIEDLNFGKAVALVELVDCRPTDDLTLKEIETEKHFGDFSLGRFAWKLRLKEAINPFPVKGRQRFFNVDWESNQ